MKYESMNDAMLLIAECGGVVINRIIYRPKCKGECRAFNSAAKYLCNEFDCVESIYAVDDMVRAVKAAMADERSAG